MYILRAFIFLCLLICVNSALSFSFFKDLISKVNNDDDSGDSCSESQGEKDTCDENQLMLLLAKLYVTSPEKIILLITCDCIDDMCRDVRKTLEKINNNFQQCTPLSSDNLFMKLYEALKTFNKTICKENCKSKKIEAAHSCLKELHGEYIDCEGPADWFEKKNATVVCQIYLEVLNCNYIKTAELCGLDIAFLMRETTVDIFKALLPVKCRTPRSLPAVEDPMTNKGKNVKRKVLIILGVFLYYTIKYVIA